MDNFLPPHIMMFPSTTPETVASASTGYGGNEQFDLEKVGSSKTSEPCKYRHSKMQIYYVT